MDPTTLLVQSLLAEEGGTLKELAPGITVFCVDRKSPGSLLTCHVTWNPELWRLGNTNPKICYLRLGFKYLCSDMPDGGDLASHLKNIMTSLVDGQEFHRHPKTIQLEEVEVTVAPPTIN